MEHNLGNAQIDLLKWLTGNWLTAGKPICFLEGFPGIGKTTIARELQVQLKPPHQVIRVDMPGSETDPIGDLLLEVATSLHEVGRNEIASAIEGGRDKAASALVSLLHSSPVVIVVDEFQRAFGKNEGPPVNAVERLIVRLGQRANSQGRLLLLTNRRVGRERWSEPYEIRTLPGLTVAEAEQLLESRLANEGRSEEVPLDRRRDVVNWLGRNPRAIGVLVEALAGDPLDYLINLNPESWEARDRDVSAELVRSLERNLLERNLDRLEPSVATFLYQLAIYRKAFKREAMQLMLTGAENVEVMKSDLLSRFFMEQHRGWFSLHEIVREIALQKLKQNPMAFRQANARAGEYFARPFKAKQMVGGELGAQFVEVRYHLVQAQREQELNEIANRFGNYLKETFSAVSPIPQERNELDERIAVLSALLIEAGPKSLEYYLARLLKHRGSPPDIKRALEHSRVATDSRAAWDQAWVLRIQLEEQVHGITEAINVARQGIGKVPRDQNLFALYQLCAELMAKAGRTEEAIALLKDGISKIPPENNVVSLYQLCAEVMANAGHNDEAIALLKDGINKIPSDKGLASLYELCAQLMAKANRDEEAIALLRVGISTIPIDQNLFTLYHSCAQLMAEAGLTGEAIGLLKDGIGRIPPDKGVSALYISCAQLMAEADLTDEAIGLLKDGIDRVPTDKGVSALYIICARLLARIDFADAIKLLREGIRAIPAAQRNRHYLTTLAIYLCAASKDQATLDSILTGTGKDAVERQQLWLGGTVRLQIRQEWEQAADFARRGRVKFPTDVALATQEAFSRLCANQPEAAELALREFPRPIQMEKDSPNCWLAAFVALRNRTVAEARKWLAAYLGRPMMEDEEVSETRLLRLWDTAVEAFSAHPTSFFPTLPPSLTGLPEPVTRQLNSPPVLTDFLARTAQQATPAATTPKNGRREVLVIATEWESKYGGLSTFNRELCKAMSRAGHRVCCLVARATADEIKSSKAAGVELVPATPTEEASDRELLFRRPALPSGFDPQVIIGHDRITGTAAQAQAADFFPQARFILFIHTAPGEIEWYKVRAKGEDTAAEVADQRENTQRELAGKASLVVAVGPRLKREIEANLVGLNVPVMQLNPGLGETRHAGHPLAAIYCLLLGRAEDEYLKGLDIAARALGQLSLKPSRFSVEPELIIRGAKQKTGDQLRERLIAISGTNLNVRVKEYTPQLERITEDIQRSSVVLMPSRREGFGLVGLEAISEGIPILVSAKSGLGELLIDKLPGEIISRCVIQVTGELETDAQEWATGIDFVLFDRKAAFARAAGLQSLLGSAISWEQGVSELFSVLSDVVSSPA
jgi:glycosyltransferase involved in cell wall biosynthesis/tetratricopeptide (TPR) repeat protein